MTGPGIQSPPQILRLMLFLRFWDRECVSFGYRPQTKSPKNALDEITSGALESERETCDVRGGKRSLAGTCDRRQREHDNDSENQAMA